MKDGLFLFPFTLSCGWAEKVFQKNWCCVFGVVSPVLTAADRMLRLSHLIKSILCWTFCMCGRERRTSLLAKLNESLCFQHCPLWHHKEWFPEPRVLALTHGPGSVFHIRRLHWHAREAVLLENIARVKFMGPSRFAESTNLCVYQTSLLMLSFLALCHSGSNPSSLVSKKKQGSVAICHSAYRGA